MDFCLFVKNWVNIGKNLSQNVRGKYSQKCLDLIKISVRGALKFTSKRLIQKTTEGTCGLIGNEIADKITKVSKTSQKYNSKTVTYDLDKERSKEKYISPERKQ